MPTILKRTAPGTGCRIPAEAFAAVRRAAARLAEAEEQAGAIVARAEADREAIRAKAEEAGRRQARAEAGAILAGAARARDRLLAASEREVVAVAIDVARKVIARELSTDPAAVGGMAASALGAARVRRQVTLRVHPDDAAATRAWVGSGPAGVPGVGIEEDGRLAPGDVVVETEAGRIDARVETQLEALREALVEALR
jgi:type III secretion system HrpE/YscL family protein